MKRNKDLSKKSILLVEDNPIIVLSMKKLLTQEG